MNVFQTTLFFQLLFYQCLSRIKAFCSIFLLYYSFYIYIYSFNLCLFSSDIFRYLFLPYSLFISFSSFLYIYFLLALSILFCYFHNIVLLYLIFFLYLFDNKQFYHQFLYIKKIIIHFLKSQGFSLHLFYHLRTYQKRIL